MKDYNFFEYYFEKRQALNLRYLCIGALLMFAISIIGVSYEWSRFQINKIENDIAGQEKMIDTKKIQQQEIEISNIKKRLEILNRYDESVQLIGDIITGTDKIDDKLIKRLVDVIPKEITLKSIEIDKKNLYMDGKAKDRVNIAELEHSLKGLNIFYNIHVNYIDDNSLKEQANGEGNKITEEQYNSILKEILKNSINTNNVQPKTNDNNEQNTGETMINPQDNHNGDNQKNNNTANNNEEQMNAANSENHKAEGYSFTIVCSFEEEGHD